MRGERAAREFVEHIVQWGERVDWLIRERTYVEFVSDLPLQLAVWKCIEVLGEAAFRALKSEPDLAERFPGLQLRNAYAMRNKLTYGYTEVDLLILWNTAVNFVPVMTDAARAALPHLKSDR